MKILLLIIILTLLAILNSSNVENCRIYQDVKSIVKICFVEDL